MSAGDGKAPGDLIGEYLNQLRASLRVAPGGAELILAEAEDHLREAGRRSHGDRASSVP